MLSTPFLSPNRNAIAKPLASNLENSDVSIAPSGPIKGQEETSLDPRGDLLLQTTKNLISSLGSVWKIFRNHTQLNLSDKKIPLASTEWAGKPEFASIYEELSSQKGEFTEQEGFIEASASSLLQGGNRAPFSDAILLKYRMQTPVTEDEKKEPFLLPLSPKMVSLLKKGSVLELYGKAGLALEKDLAGAKSWQRASLGLCATSNVKMGGEGRGDVRVQVFALDGKGLVAVKVTHGLKKGGGFNADVLVSLASQLGNPKEDKGFLASLESEGLLGPLKEALKEGSLASLTYQKENDYESSRQYGYLLDLKDKKTHEVYEHLTRFSLEKAEEAAKSQSVKVEKMVHEKSSSLENGGITLGGRTFFRFLNERASESIKDSQNSAKPVEHKKLYHKVFENIFTGIREITWSAVSSASEKLFALKVLSTSKNTNKKDLEDFFTLANILNVQTKGDVQKNPTKTNRFSSMFTSLDDIHLNLELFIHKNGVQKLDEVSYEKAFYAYLDTLSQFDLEASGLKNIDRQKREKLVEMATEYLTDDLSSLYLAHGLNYYGKKNLEMQYFEQTEILKKMPPTFLTPRNLLSISKILIPLMGLAMKLRFLLVLARAGGLNICAP